MASQLLFCQFCGLIIDQNEIKNNGNNICNKNAFNICQFNISDEFSSTIKTYQEIEAKNNPDYENSHAKEKADFGTGLLDIFAGILAFFGL
jgi:hypothetical protein